MVAPPPPAVDRGCTLPPAQLFPFSAEETDLAKIHRAVLGGFPGWGRLSASTVLQSLQRRNETWLGDPTLMRPRLTRLGQARLWHRQPPSRFSFNNAFPGFRRPSELGSGSYESKRLFRKTFFQDLPHQDPSSCEGGPADFFPPRED